MQWLSAKYECVDDRILNGSKLRNRLAMMLMAVLTRKRIAIGILIIIDIE
jgi:hypothetical protein